MIFTAYTVTGAKAAAFGLANHCYPGDMFEDDVAGVVAAITAISPFSIAAYKRLLAQTDGVPLHHSLAYEVRSTPGVGSDMAERVARLFRK